MPHSAAVDYTLTDPNGEITITRLVGQWYPFFNLANVLAVDMGQPALADDNRLLTSVVMANGAYTLDETDSADGLARNVTVTHTTDTTTDTLGTVTVVGTDINGDAISEVITPTADSEVVGDEAFLAITSCTQAGHTQAGGVDDTIEIGIGNKIGLPSTIRATPAVAAATQVRQVVLGSALVAVTAVIDADELEKCVVDASAGTYDGSKELTAFISRD